MRSLCPQVSPAGPNAAPLWPIARWNSPRASGEAMRWLTVYDPADRPNSVTHAGSPPNASMLRCTHSSAATQSISP